MPGVFLRVCASLMIVLILTSICSLARYGWLVLRLSCSFSFLLLICVWLNFTSLGRNRTYISFAGKWEQLAGSATLKNRQQNCSWMEFDCRFRPSSVHNVSQIRLEAIKTKLSSQRELSSITAVLLSCVVPHIKRGVFSVLHAQARTQGHSPNSPQVTCPPGCDVMRSRDANAKSAAA
jgi:hypothetical protein